MKFYLKTEKEMEREIMLLRYLLWTALDDGTGYGDDGEMQLWGMDFKRADVDSLEAGIAHRRMLGKGWE